MAEQQLSSAAAAHTGGSASSSANNVLNHNNQLEETSVISHSRTNSTTSSASTDDGLVLSVANLKGSSDVCDGNKLSACLLLKNKSLMGQTDSQSSAGKNMEPSSNDESVIKNGDLRELEEQEQVGLQSLDVTTNALFTKLQNELELAQTQLKLKEEQVDKLSRIREEVESELHDLTASLFQEAHKMVGEANVKRAASERSLAEASLKIDGLQTEVSALRTLVLTSTPARPNKHLHPHLSQSSPSASTSTLNSSEPCSEKPEKEEERLIDPVLRKEYLTWKKSPTLEKQESDFLKRIYREDVEPCLDFPNGKLAKDVFEAVRNNNLAISPIIGPKSDDDEQQVPKNCALLEAPLLCRYKVRLEGVEEEFCISQLARNRIAAACECLNYLRYIRQGLVKSHHNDVYWEIVQRRKKMVIAKLGYSPDD